MATNRLRYSTSLKEAQVTTSTDYRTTVRVNAPADVVFNAVTATEALTA